MKPPWDYGLSVADDAESLQTDVMRFIAILGLCLTAIFSLVNAAREESLQSTVVETVAEQAVTVQKPEVAPKRESVPALRPAGFTLEFSSEAALRDLSDAGVVQVYAIAADVYWLLGAGGRLRKVNSPASYYQMDGATLPSSIVQAAQNAGFANGVSWGVALPARIARDIQGIMSGKAGGALVIEADGRVHLE